MSGQKNGVMFSRMKRYREYFRVIIPAQLLYADSYLKSFVSRSQPLLASLPLPLTTSAPRGFPLPVFASSQISACRTDGFCSASARSIYLSVYVLFRSSCRFLSRSRTHSQTHSFVFFRFMISLSLFLSRSFFHSFSDRLFSHPTFCFTPRPPFISHVLDDLARVVRSSREPPLFFHHQTPNRDFTYPRRRTATYSHSGPTCRIIRNSPAKTRIAVANPASTGLE